MALTENQKRIKRILSNQFKTYTRINRMRERAAFLEAKGKYDVAKTIYDHADQLEFVLEVYEQHSNCALKKRFKRAHQAYYIISEREVTQGIKSIDEICDLFQVKGARMRFILNDYVRYFAECISDGVEA